MDPVNRARCPRDTNAEGPRARMRSFVGTRIAEEIIGASPMLPTPSWEALVFGIPRDLWEGIQLKYPP